MTVLLAATAASLFGIGSYLILQRKLSRIIIGLALLTHGANVLLIGSGQRGEPPLIGEGGSKAFSDPLPQALALTSIVITFGVTTLLLALAFRSWLLTRDDEVEDDVGDRAVASGADDPSPIAGSEADVDVDVEAGEQGP
jgi:multicomponent Na+:H+ antiporter subunit C